MPDFPGLIHNHRAKDGPCHPYLVVLRIFLPSGAGITPRAGAAPDAPPTEVLLFLASPWMRSLADMQVRVLGWAGPGQGRASQTGSAVKAGSGRWPSALPPLPTCRLPPPPPRPPPLQRAPAGERRVSV